MIASVLASMLGMFTALRISPLNKHRADLLGDLDADAFLRFRRGGAEVRREHEIRDLAHAANRPRGGSSSKDVERRRGDVLALQRLDQRRLVDQPAARAVDDAHALLRLRQPLGD